MSRRSRKSGPSPLVGIVLLAFIAAALGLAWHFRHRGAATAPPAPPVAEPVAASPPVVSAERVDPANEGRVVAASGMLRVGKPVRDGQLGIEAPADAVALLRKVEMLQWRERCAGSACNYELAWSEQPIDSAAFRDKTGHVNSARFPFTSERFVSEGMRFGAFTLDPALARTAADSIVMVALPVHASQLPPNLAATFRERAGVFYAGSSADKPEPGDLRVSYRTVTAGQRRVVGEQHGDRLQAVANH